MGADSTPESAPVCVARYSVTGDSIEDLTVNTALLMAAHGWPGFRITNYKKGQKYAIVLPGGPEFALDNGLVPLEVVLRFKIRPMTDAERRGESDDNGGVKPVDEYCAMRMNGRLSDGFAALAGNTASHLPRYDARSKESLARWQSKQKPGLLADEGFYSDKIPPGDPGGSAHPNDADGGVNLDFGGIAWGGSSFRDLFSQFFRGGRTDPLAKHHEET